MARNGAAGAGHSAQPTTPASKDTGSACGGSGAPQHGASPIEVPVTIPRVRAHRDPTPDLHLSVASGRDQNAQQSAELEPGTSLRGGRRGRDRDSGSGCSSPHDSPRSFPRGCDTDPDPSVADKFQYAIPADGSSESPHSATDLARQSDGSTAACTTTPTPAAATAAAAATNSAAAFESCPATAPRPAATTQGVPALARTQPFVAGQAGAGAGAAGAPALHPSTRATTEPHPALPAQRPGLSAATSPYMYDMYATRALFESANERERDTERRLREAIQSPLGGMRLYGTPAGSPWGPPPTPPSLMRPWEGAAGEAAEHPWTCRSGALVQAAAGGGHGVAAMGCGGVPPGSSVRPRGGAASEAGVEGGAPPLGTISARDLLLGRKPRPQHRAPHQPPPQLQQPTPQQPQQPTPQPQPQPQPQRPQPTSEPSWRLSSPSGPGNQQPPPLPASQPGGPSFDGTDATVAARPRGSGLSETVAEGVAAPVATNVDGARAGSPVAETAAATVFAVTSAAAAAAAAEELRLGRTPPPPAGPFSMQPNDAEPTFAPTPPSIQPSSAASAPPSGAGPGTVAAAELEPAFSAAPSLSHMLNPDSPICTSPDDRAQAVWPVAQAAAAAVAADEDPVELSPRARREQAQSAAGSPRPPLVPVTLAPAGGGGAMAGVMALGQLGSRQESLDSSEISIDAAALLECSSSLETNDVDGVGSARASPSPPASVRMQSRGPGAPPQQPPSPSPCAAPGCQQPAAAELSGLGAAGGAAAAGGTDAAGAEREWRRWAGEGVPAVCCEQFSQKRSDQPQPHQQQQQQAQQQQQVQQGLTRPRGGNESGRGSRDDGVSPPVLGEQQSTASYDTSWSPTAAPATPPAAAAAAAATALPPSPSSRKSSAFETAALVEVLRDDFPAPPCEASPAAAFIAAAGGPHQPIGEAPVRPNATAPATGAPPPEPQLQPCPSPDAHVYGRSPAATDDQHAGDRGSGERAVRTSPQPGEGNGTSSTDAVPFASPAGIAAAAAAGGAAASWTPSRPSCAGEQRAQGGTDGGARPSISGVGGGMSSYSTDLAQIRASTSVRERRSAGGSDEVPIRAVASVLACLADSSDDDDADQVGASPHSGWREGNVGSVAQWPAAVSRGAQPSVVGPAAGPLLDRLRAASGNASGQADRNLSQTEQHQAAAAAAAAAAAPAPKDAGVAGLPQRRGGLALSAKSVDESNGTQGRGGEVGWQLGASPTVQCGAAAPTLEEARLAYLKGQWQQLCAAAAAMRAGSPQVIGKSGGVGGVGGSSCTVTGGANRAPSGSGGGSGCGRGTASGSSELRGGGLSGGIATALAEAAWQREASASRGHGRASWACAAAAVPHGKVLAQPSVPVAAGSSTRGEGHAAMLWRRYVGAWAAHAGYETVRQHGRVSGAAASGATGSQGPLAKSVAERLMTSNPLFWQPGDGAAAELANGGECGYEGE